ncbi:MAG: SIR2 family protein [Bacteroidia bacterium]
MVLETAIEKILSGRAILFTGSGFGYGAKNILDNNLLLGSDLTNYLYEMVGINKDEHDNDLKNASELFVDGFGVHKLIELLKEQFTVKSITEEHNLIGTLPWKRVYTTNYDGIIEKAYTEAGKLLTPVSLNEKIDQYKDFRKLCVHLNGYINKLTPDTLNSDFKLTNTSYLTTEFVNSSWISMFRSDLRTAEAIIFIGFSTSSDLDISRIMAEKLEEIKEKCFFIVSPTEALISEMKLKKFGAPLKIGLLGLCEQIKEKQKNYEPPVHATYVYKSFNEILIPERIPIIKDQLFQDFMLLGHSQIDLIHQSIVDPQKYPYFVLREETNAVMDKISEGQTDFVVHSNIGNGKTSFLQGLSVCAVQRGIRTFIFNKYFDLTTDEVERICSLGTKVMVIIEHYSNHFELIEKFKHFRTNNVILVFSERTMVNDTVYYSLEKLIGENYNTYSLEALKELEPITFSELLSNYGLWGEYAKMSSEAKRRKVTDDFKSSFRLVLLDIMRSPDIQLRLKSIVDSVKGNSSFYDACLLIIASNILGFDMEYEDLIYSLDDELLNNPSFYNNPQLKDIIDFDNHLIRIKSSILSEGILHTNEYSHDLITLLVKVVKRLDKTRSNKNHLNFLKSIISHSRLQKLFNTREKNEFRDLVIMFFEEVKQLEYSKRNPYFWLQYAMAKLEMREYIVADTFFNTAYSYADKLDWFDTYQIDNHYARLLLENEVYNGSTDTCMAQFLKAHKILNNKSDKNENRHYPFKVARNYTSFYDHYFRKLPDQDKRIFLVSCQEILRRIDEYNSVVDVRARNRVVKECFDGLSAVLFKESKYLK